MKLFNNLKASSIEKNQGEAHWQAPSNIALIKYWGKRELQLPSNPSLSFSLSKCLTQTKVKYSFDQKQNKIAYTLISQDIKSNAKMNKFFNILAELFPKLHHFSFEIETQNTFPHSVGIASSASGYAALSLSLLSCLHEAFGVEEDENFFKKASSIARIGSGSACRSLLGGFSLWGKNKYVPQSSDEYSVGIDDIHQDFRELNNLICIVDKEPKKVSSSQGHELMNQHPFKVQRFSQAYENLNSLLSILRTGDWRSFAGIVENEALTLHALMMSSDSPYLLMTADTLKAIEVVKSYQKQDHYLAYTMDAGPNLHIFYHPQKCKVIDKLKAELKERIEDCDFIEDKIGSGARKL